MKISLKRKRSSDNIFSLSPTITARKGEVLICSAFKYRAANTVTALFEGAQTINLGRAYRSVACCCNKNLQMVAINIVDFPVPGGLRMCPTTTLERNGSSGESEIKLGMNKDLHAPLY